jgi:hypothetical protein
VKTQSEAMIRKIARTTLRVVARPTPPAPPDTPSPS